MESGATGVAELGDHVVVPSRAFLGENGVGGSSLFGGAKKRQMGTPKNAMHKKYQKMQTKCKKGKKCNQILPGFLMQKCHPFQKEKKKRKSDAQNSDGRND